MKTRHEPLFCALALAAVAAMFIAACSKQEDPRMSVSISAAPVAPVAPVATTTVGTEIDDSVITTKAKAALLADPGVKSFDFKVDTRKGVVQLSGFVNSQADIESAMALVGKIEGVKGVEHSMTIKEGKTTAGNVVDDSVITTKVKSALLGESSVKSIDIGVVTRKGVVQLSGFVDNQAQVTRAIQLAERVGGVKSVTNEMSIKK